VHLPDCPEGTPSRVKNLQSLEQAESMDTDCKEVETAEQSDNTIANKAAHSENKENISQGTVPKITLEIPAHESISEDSVASEISDENLEKPVTRSSRKGEWSFQLNVLSFT